MAGRGFAPSGTRSRENDQRRDEAAVMKVNPDDIERGFDLPVLEPDVLGDRTWPAMTRRWWARWRKSPQAQTFTETDWDFLLETALIHRAFILGDLKQAAELRLRVAKYGATPEDRMRLRLQITAPSEAKVEPAAPASAGRKDRLLRAVQ
jgi:hypothetical protein